MEVSSKENLYTNAKKNGYEGYVTNHKISSNELFRMNYSDLLAIWTIFSGLFRYTEYQKGSFMIKHFDFSCVSSAAYAYPYTRLKSFNFVISTYQATHQKLVINEPSVHHIPRVIDFVSRNKF